MRDTEAAFRWIIGILQKHRIPFQVTGGFAARLYGAERDLLDIDFDIPEDRFAELVPEVKNYITFGPAQYKDQNWDLFLLSLSYQGQDVDLGGAYETKVLNHETNEWVLVKADFLTARLMEVYGIQVPVVNKEELLRYKSILGRDVDVIDVQQMTAREKIH